tara:strand:+ start:529 stop:645 length:117 start_codon:yes stop_codon:yes gene_type:complete
MKKFLLIISIAILFAACGVKDDPEYKSQINNKKTIYLV